ncbi:TolC family protein [Marinomonas mediterranea]|uniref:Outer membrane efflux protein n=1 Tax=Marinomonas mediterranea (strain ATCC 700492 / JCM 21426 / NBRC 103028 / MMB-1) TaxID=717774 RepID=F2K0K8_MARM1|nr:TolC family protein [Marinomonas mediterranea]ADZ90992.1 outer membrane efflux protein [Marinomonas mediterranea MMB-1]WCN17134.1 TolC family protein [Marinomonas mediterranea MMB-1]
MTVNAIKKLGTLAICLPLLACSTLGTEENSRENFAEKAQQDLTNVEESRSIEWQALDTATQNNYLTDLIQDSTLNKVIQQALNANPSLQKTALTLKASQWKLKSNQGEHLPSVEAGLGADRSKSSDTNYSAKISVSWELDLWQKLADSEKATAKSLASEAALYQASKDALVANVMKTWLALTAKQHAIAIEEKRLALLESNEALIVKRFKNGLDNLEKLDEARTSSSQSRASLLEYQENLAIKKRELEILLGSDEAILIPINNHYPNVDLTFNNLHTQRLQRRPDLKSAFLDIQAADLNTSVAYKDMLPSFSLSAALNDSADSPSSALFTAPIWSLAAQLTQPLYKGGQLKAAAEVAKLNTAQAYQAYRDTLLTAVNEVENALGQEKVLQQQVQHISAALKSSQSNLDQYQKKYRSGLIELSELITVQKTTFDLEAQLDELIYNHLANRVTLGLALGLGVAEQ